MNVYDITLDCDHKMLVVASDEAIAMKLAVAEAQTHNATVEAITEVSLTQGLLAWYPGPFSMDAISEEEES
jgi:hypothetical protein